MGYGFAYDPTGTKCSGGAQPGALALARYSKARWVLPLVGVYNCRPARGSSNLSTHGEGRGVDLHVHVRAVTDPPRDVERTKGDEIAVFYVTHAEALGVQRVIWLDREWNSRRRTWGHYGGVFHGNHPHVELCWAAAKALSVADLETVGKDSFMAALTEDEQRELYDRTTRILAAVDRLHWGVLDPEHGLRVMVAAIADPATFAEKVAEHVDGVTSDQIEAAVRAVFADAADAD